MNRCLCRLLLAALPATGSAAGKAFPGADGFGAFSQGGKGGRVIWVSRLDDDPGNPRPGMFRWAVMQPGPRIVKFSVAGNIGLQDRIVVRESRLAIDGGDAPALGVCIKGGALEFRGVHDVIVRHIRVRLGDVAGLRAGRLPFRWRPDGSRGLDCISLHECERVIIDHCSLSWSCDEIVSVVRCRGVTVQRCILSEPLASWRLHPYGSRHAFCLNASASTLSVLGCLFARYEMRGPQFEANDMRRSDEWDVKMEAAGNVMFDFKDSGSRYTTGVEDHKDEAAGRQFRFQFTGNRYLAAPGSGPPVAAATKHGVHPGVRACILGNVAGNEAPLVRLDDGTKLDAAPGAVRGQLRSGILFSPGRRTSSKAPDPASLLAEAGCSFARDAVDQRIVRDARQLHFRPLLRSQDEVGGWPRLNGRPDRGMRTRIAESLFGR